ncbi:predicted protein [Naegleria gruberi]|uniref:Predicted protein n=1 Tax=Naegleria gruberi TaxID=5762 RepID=D2V797_NAEGR|nr:uncharacterized protein NAEGRDRAFT_64718 [Naegleria gruberi]EFC47336.1 predicted protein [Naegleria gruberi]|eukprot:XP_002680080.1 predicted protein [Naegleria gruberi strain NEG-M]
MSSLLDNSELDLFDNQQSIEEMQREMDTNLTMLKQTSILDDEFDDLNGSLGGSFFDPTGSKLSPLEMSDILLSPTILTPRANLSMGDEEKRFMDGEFFEKEIMVKKERDKAYYITKMDSLMPDIKYETPSGNLIEKKGVNNYLINEKYIHYPSPLGNSAKLLNLKPGSQKDLLTEDKVLPNISDRKSVAHNIRLMAASKLLSEAQEDESGEWLFTPNIQGNPKTQITFSVPGSKVEKKEEDDFLIGDSSEDEFFQASPVLEDESKYVNDEKAKKQATIETINQPPPPQPVIITKSKPKTKTNAVDPLRRSEPSKPIKDMGYKPQFFNPTDEIKCKEPSEKKKQQWDKTSTANTSSGSIGSTAVKKPSLKDAIPTNSTMFPPPSAQNSPRRGSISSLTSIVTDVRKSVERVPVNTQIQRVKTPTIGDMKAKKKPSRPNTTGNSKSFTTSRPNSPLTVATSLPETKQELDQYDVTDTFSEISTAESVEMYDNDFSSFEVHDRSQPKNWKLMQWRRENYKERTRSSSFSKMSGESKSSTPTPVGYISDVFYSPPTSPQHKPSYDSIVIARDFVMEVIDMSFNKAIEKRSIEQHSIAFFGKTDVTRYVDDIISSSHHNSYRLILNVSISLFLDKKLTELDWVEEDVPCFVEFYKIFENDPSRNQSLFKIFAFYYSFVNVGGGSNLLERDELSKSFYYNIDVVQNNRTIPFERGAKYEWKLRENLYLPVPFADRKQKLEPHPMDPSLQSTFFSLFHIKDLKGPENEKYITPYQLSPPQTPVKEKPSSSNSALKTDENIFAVNLNASESNSPPLTKQNNQTKNVNDTLHTDDIQLSPIFMPPTPLPNKNPGKPVQEKEAKCCSIM